MRELALFAGAGGGILGGLLLGWRTVCAVELDSYCRSALLARQRDGVLPRFPIWDDVRTFDGKPWNGGIDVISGGFPCQDISSAGTRAGLAGARSGLWREFARIIEEVAPTHVFIENSQHLRTRGLVTILQDLARMGFHARWGVLGADNVRAPHHRKRMWIVAHAPRFRRPPREDREDVVSADESPFARPSCVDAGSVDVPNPNNGRERKLAVDGEVGYTSTVGEFDESYSASQIADWWPVDIIQGVDDGMAHWMDRVAATGNGQVPRVARMAWETLK